MTAHAARCSWTRATEGAPIRWGRGTTDRELTGRESKQIEQYVGKRKLTTFTILSNKHAEKERASAATSNAAAVTAGSMRKATANAGRSSRERSWLAMTDGCAMQRNRLGWAVSTGSRWRLQSRRGSEVQTCSEESGPRKVAALLICRRQELRASVRTYGVARKGCSRSKGNKSVWMEGQKATRAEDETEARSGKHEREKTVGSVTMEGGSDSCVAKGETHK